MKNIYLTMLGLVAGLSANAQVSQWVGTAGAASTSGTTATLTSQNGDKVGAAWLNTKVNFTRAFTLKFKARFTVIAQDTDLGNTGGGDGIACVFKQNASTTSINNVGGELGYYGNATPDFLRSIGVEFDIFDNGTGSVSTYNDPGLSSDHVMIAENGDFGQPHSAAVALNGTVGIEDGLYHNCQIVWTSADSTMKVYYQGIQKVSMVIPYHSIFSNPASVTTGFTGGAFQGVDRQDVDSVVITTPPTVVIETDPGASIFLENAPNPFSAHTEISYTLPATVASAFLSVTDLSGREVRRVELAQPGSGRITIDGAGLGSGAYLYSLIADGCIVATRRMVLSK